MIYSYIQQFIPEKSAAERLLITVFTSLAPRLEQACDSNLSVYCWLQVEARKIILEHTRQYGHDHGLKEDLLHLAGGAGKGNYLALLKDASADHQWVFRESFLRGRPKEELASETGKDLRDISRLLTESLLIIRSKLA